MPVSFEFGGLTACVELFSVTGAHLWGLDRAVQFGINEAPMQRLQEFSGIGFLKGVRVNTFILLIVTKAISMQPANFKIIEFQSKEACELALEQAKKFWITVNIDSRCIDVAKETKIKDLKNELKKASDE